MKMPSQEEQTEAENYVLNRELIRPDTTYKKAVICSISYVLITFAFSCALYYLLDWLGIFLSLPESFKSFYCDHPFAFQLLFFICIYVVIGLCLLRKAIIGIIHLYQHYAPEDVRRRCLFKPTCSEYAILAIKKYGVLIGLIKAYIRLFKKCRGNIYRIDYP